MKKTLLTLACAMLLGAAANAQTTPPQPWTIVSVGSAVPTNYITEDIVTVNPATVWVLYREVSSGTTALPVRTYARTIDGGTTWTGGALNIPTDLNVSNITAIDGNTAWIAAFSTTSNKTQQGVYKTTDGGVTWTKQGTATYSQADSFPNGVYFFDANNGVTFGDPQPAGIGQRMEIYTTTNGGTNWTRNTTSAPVVNSNQEYGLAGSFFALGNTIWHGGVSDDGSGPASGQGARLYKSTDRGLTWTAADTDLPYAVSNLAFTSPSRGLLSSGFDLLETLDGGATNSTLLYSGHFRGAGLDAVPGLNNTYVSVGVIDTTSTLQSGYNGSSISYDGGQTWKDMLSRGVSINQYEVDMFSPSVGFTGSFTQGTTANPNVNLTGVTKLNTVITGSKNAVALRGVLQVFPNPSNDGRFTMNVNLPAATKRDLTVTDALGRVVKQIKLNATGAAVQNQALDLSQFKAGVYTLRLVTEQGTAVEKLVVN
ncbi:T9SS type A sorting domain-containing protein [Hymenobacter edaphi]|uniref:Secretion system C-terminal sorting domain-containing protein n=1 Tax=Hymenobacter edaphi TaxID=2211146 RepID=A0A328BUI2_9BACT|nr:T9SS type A sorting domain-containing protein [Hymenobacter edaphi]RAK69686.1 hypothetical protein DLM85_02180 [Hymenobacter edaphi]